MNYQLYSDVILISDILEKNLYAGDLGTVVQLHQGEDLEMRYSVEFFNMLGNTVAVVTLPASCLRLPTHADRPSVRFVKSLVG